MDGNTAMVLFFAILAAMILGMMWIATQHADDDDDD